MIVKLILPFLLCTTAICGDNLVETFNDNHLLKALIDNGTHTIIGGLSWCIVCIHRKSILSAENYLWEIILCTAISSLIDVDHFISARSIRLQDVHLLKSRPFLHNTSLMASIWIILIIVSFIYRNQTINCIGWIFFAAFASHHTRDATRRGYWFHPFGSSNAIAYWMYIIITLILPYIVAHFLNIFKPHTIHERIINIEAIQSIV